jgi:hypothetical protein
MINKRFLKWILGIGFGLCALPGLGQDVWNLNMLTDSVSVTGPFSDNRSIVVSQRQTRYSEPVKKFGLHFRNGLQNAMQNKISMANLFGSMILGAHGPGTVVEYNGTWSSDGGQSFPSLVVLQEGKIVFGPQANIDLVLPGSYFTRQFWCLGDGTGTIEFAPGFIADRTLQGQVDSGLGSIRFSNCRFITHETQGLPLGYRPNPALINSHLVFENQAGSRWITKSNPQDYKGGLWVRKSMTVETATPLTLSGLRSQWSDYTNYGGIFLEDTNLTLTKEGPADLILSGEQGYAPGAVMDIRQGWVHMRSNPYVPADSAFYAAGGRKTGQNLTLQLKDTAGLSISTPQCRIRNLTCQGTDTRIRIQAGTTLWIRDSARFNGKFQFELAPGQNPIQGDSFQVFALNFVEGRFSEIALPGNNLLWDTTQLYNRGVLRFLGFIATEGVFNDPGTKSNTGSSGPFPDSNTRKCRCGAEKHIGDYPGDILLAGRQRTPPSQYSKLCRRQLLPDRFQG